MRRTLKYLALAVFGLIISYASVQAAELREIELTDGSLISGEVVSLANGVYTIKWTLGTIQISESKVRSIRTKGANRPEMDGQVSSIREKMTGHADIMDLVRSLQSDPDFQAALNDPEIINAAQAGNVSALMANPKFMRLLKKQAVQQIKNLMSQ